MESGGEIGHLGPQDQAPSKDSFWPLLGLSISFQIAKVTAQIAKTLGFTLIRYRSDAFVSDRYLIDINPKAFAIWVRIPGTIIMTGCTGKYQTCGAVSDNIFF